MGFDTDVFSLIVIVVSLVVSLSFHEAMHAFVGLKLGDTTAQEAGRVSFNPLRHIDPLMTIILPVVTLVLFHFPFLAAKPVPFDPQRVTRFREYGTALIAAAGPFTNLALAGIGGLLAHAFVANVTFFHILIIFTELNIVLFVFNMVPIPPLDGSRVLYTFAPEAIQEFMVQIEQFGLFIVLGLVVFVPAFSQILINIDTSITNFLL